MSFHYSVVVPAPKLKEDIDTLSKEKLAVTMRLSSSSTVIMCTSKLDSFCSIYMFLVGYAHVIASLG